MIKITYIYKQLCISLILIIFSAFIGLLLLCCSFLLSYEKILDNSEKSAKILENEGAFPCLALPLTYVLDNNTDAKMILYAQDECDNNILNRALMIYSHSNSIQFDDSIAAIKLHYNDRSNISEHTYSRYWHGYLIYLKLLLQIFDLWGIRVFNTVILVLLILLLIYILYKKQFTYLIPGLLLSILFFRLICTFLSLQFFPCFIICIISCIVVLKKPKKLSYLLLFCLTGVSVAYFDFFTYPIITLCFPLVILMCKHISCRIEDNLKILFLSICFWFLGYIGMWSCKWALVSILTPNNCFNEAFAQANAHVSNSNIANLYPIPDFIYNFASLFPRVWTAIFLYGLVFFTPCTIIFIVFCIVKIRSFYIKIKVKFLSKQNLFYMLPFLFIAVMPFFWYFCIAGHSYHHFGFTYKSAISSIFACTAYLSMIKNIILRDSLLDVVCKDY